MLNNVHLWINVETLYCSFVQVIFCILFRHTHPLCRDSHPTLPQHSIYDIFTTYIFRRGSVSLEDALQIDRSWVLVKTWQLPLAPIDLLVNDIDRESQSLSVCILQYNGFLFQFCFPLLLWRYLDFCHH